MKAVLVLAIAFALVAGCGESARPAQRPGLQRMLDSLVTGQFRAAPGAVAYVSGPHGIWEGAAGFADVARRVPMTPDVRSRIGSVSKLWTATVVVKLAQEGKLRLDDTVEKWLPGTFPYGNRITIRELLNHTSGMVDDNDIQAKPGYWLARVHNATLRRELLAVGRASAKNPAITISPEFEMQVAGALPLLFSPGTDYHYSNIGYKTAAAIAEKASHASLADLYRRFITDPLKLTSAGYDPAATITSSHALGYVIQAGGKARSNAGAGEGALAASGGVVVSAPDEARFLVALVQGRIVSKSSLRQIEQPTFQPYGLGTGIGTICGVRVFTHGGATNSYMAEVAVDGDGTRVVVLLTNGRTYNSWADYLPAQVLDDLFCAA
ncbi:MAG TPA: serine hydrolase domain-containing protein [Solirubrobacteraceae bacterium]|nr:serine hydrolase domain-containing protein [Solirubrobacteraceae bacterium]